MRMWRQRPMLASLVADATFACLVACGLRQRRMTPLVHAGYMNTVVARLIDRGGAAGRAELVRACGSAAFKRALEDGTLIRVARGRYVLGTANDAVRQAAARCGVLSYRSAAQQHGWAQRKVPARPDVTFARNRRVPREWRSAITPHWSDLPTADVDGLVTNQRRTLIDCMRMLKLNESVPIVDSAVRCGDVSRAELRELARSMRGRGRVRAMYVAAMATKLTANPFESGLRAIAATVPGLRVRPQVPMRVMRRRDGPRTVLRPDLLDETLRIVIEAESFEWHGKVAALTRDCARYNAFVKDGWLVVRFSWYQVTFDPDYVRWVLVRAVEHRRSAAA